MIRFLSCFWNAEKYIQNCIKSLQNQKDTKFKVHLIDDLSDDNSSKLINNLIKNDERFELTINTEKKFKLKNFDNLISNFDDEDIIIELDGDDFLLGSDVVSDIREVYKNNKVWLTNGSFIYSNGSKGFSAKCNPDSVRNDVFRFSHIRTWKVFLWNSIPKNYFTDSKGNYFKSAADVAYSIPLLERAGNENYRFLEKFYYVYNAESPLNDHKNGSAAGGLQEQMSAANEIRNKQKLDKLIR